MKTFEDICRMSQAEVKAYMKAYLQSNQYKVANEDGFLYAKGTEPVLLIAHMDTVHKQKCDTITNVNGKLSSPQGIGGDDRCGIFIIMNIVKDLHCSVLLCEDEEIGCIGANKFADTDYINNLGVNYMIEFDRKGNSDAVFYSCDNKDFINFVTDTTNFQFASGSLSDISVLMPKAKLSAVNLSCGFYNAHTVGEYVIYDEMIDTIDAAKVLIKEKVDKPFEYIKKTYSFDNFNSRHRSVYPDSYEEDYYGSMFDSPKANRMASFAARDTDIELEAIIYDSSCGEEALLATGETKAECWMNLFLENPDLCFNDIVDYSWN